MLPSAPWLNITLALAICVTVFAFTAVVANSLKKNGVGRKLHKVLIPFSLSVAFLSSIYIYILSGGALAQWHSLGIPEEGDPAVKVVEIGYVQAQSGNIYYFTGIDRGDSGDGNWTEGVWEQVDKVDKKGFRVSSPHTCGTLPFLPVLRQDFTDSKAACFFTMRQSMAKVVYAVDDDGHVYSWSNDSDEFRVWDMGVIFLHRIEITFFVLGGMVSCISGLIIIMLLMLLNLLKRKYQSIISK